MSNLKEKLFNRLNSKDGIYNIHEEIDKKVSNFKTNNPYVVKDEMWKLISEEWSEKLSTIISEEISDYVKEEISKHINQYHT